MCKRLGFYLSITIIIISYIDRFDWLLSPVSAGYFSRRDASRIALNEKQGNGATAPRCAAVRIRSRHTAFNQLN
jgi:hypothetical protein